MNNFKSLEKIESEYMYWGKVRSVQTNIIWKSSDGRFTHLVSLNDEHLVNTIRSVYEKSKMASELSFIDEIQEYEGVKYSEWLRLLTNEYRYRKVELEYSDRTLERVAHGGDPHRARPLYKGCDDLKSENKRTGAGTKARLALAPNGDAGFLAQMHDNLLNTFKEQITIDDVAEYLGEESIDEDNYELENYYLNGVPDEQQIMF